MQKYLKNILIFTGITLLFLTFDIVFIIAFKLLNIDINNITSKTEIILVLIKDLVIATVLFLLYRTTLRKKLSEFKNHFGNYLDISIKSWFIGLVIMFIANVVINNLNSTISENETAVQSIISNYPIIAFFLTTFLAPFIEEMIFRLSLRKIIPNNIIFIIISGLLFGYLHVIGSTNPIEYLYIISYGSLGASFAYILTKTNNIYCSIMMHMIHNGLLTLMSVVL